MPAAALHLQLAKDETETAKKMATKGDERAMLVHGARRIRRASWPSGSPARSTVHADALKATEELKAVRARGNP